MFGAWRNMAMNKGAASIAEGMRQGQAKYEKNFSPILNAIKGAVDSLPPRSTDPMADVDARLKPVAMAAHSAGKRS